MALCDVCFRHCEIPEGGTGFCGARICEEGRVKAGNYGEITSLALDPVEKKPLARFFPGHLVLSVGSYGCNLRCPFCQNYSISQAGPGGRFAVRTEKISPEELAETAAAYRDRGNIGLAFTYNEPLIGYEFVRDTAKLVHELGMKNILVSNGTASLRVLEEIGQYIDAMNIDLKGFQDSFYMDVLKGDRRMVLDFIARAVQLCHVELTTLIIPGENDTEEEMRQISGWIAELTDASGKTIGGQIPLHISRFFPRYRMQDRAATRVDTIYRLVDIAREKLTYVYPGNC